MAQERNVEQEVARGASARTPVFLIGGMTFLIGSVFVVALAVALAAYFLAR